MSGDGASSWGSPIEARNEAIDDGITINGLIIQFGSDGWAESGLTAHYETEVIGGEGAFMMIAKDFEDFERAIRAKLIREILGTIVAKNP